MEDMIYMILMPAYKANSQIKHVPLMHGKIWPPHDHHSTSRGGMTEIINQREITDKMIELQQLPNELIERNPLKRCTHYIFYIPTSVLAILDPPSNTGLDMDWFL